MERKKRPGVIGKVSKVPIGSYLYRKRLQSGKIVVCEVQVFGLAVRRQQKRWLEKWQRETAWFSPGDAALPKGPESADGVLSAQEVAQAALKGLDEGAFLILPQAVVEDYRHRKSENYDRWIAGMSKLAGPQPS